MPRKGWKWPLLAACCLISACTANEGKAMSFDLAETYFGQHQAQLTRIVALVDACRAERPGANFTRIFTQSDNENSRCTRADPALLASLIRNLKDNGLVSASYSLGKDGRLSEVDLGVQYTGISVSGSTTELLFYSVPLSRPDLIDDAKGHRDETRALTTAPAHWFWHYNLT